MLTSKQRAILRVQAIGSKFVLYKQKQKESKYADLLK